MKKAVVGICLGIVFLILLILVTAPAKTVIPLIKKALPNSVNNIQIGEATGSLWTPKLKQVQYKKIKLEELNLNISPISLLLGNFKSHVKIIDPKLNLDGQVFANKEIIQLMETQIDLSAALLDPFMTFPVSGLYGDISAEVESLETNSSLLFENLVSHGSWEDAKIKYLEQELSLGNFDFKAYTNSDSIIIMDILNNDGFLDLRGSLTLSHNRNYSLDISMSKDLPQRFRGWVEKLGKLENNRYKILWKGQL